MQCKGKHIRKNSRNDQISFISWILSVRLEHLTKQQMHHRYMRDNKDQAHLHQGIIIELMIKHCDDDQACKCDFQYLLLSNVDVVE